MATTDPLPLSEQLPCQRPKYMKGWCGTHATKRILRCRACDNCIEFKSILNQMDITRRVERSALRITKKVVLWTLGTGWENNTWNLKLLRRAWNDFNMYMHNVHGMKMYVRVFEAGSKGGKLHIHFIAPAFNIWHSDAIKQWRRIYLKYNYKSLSQEKINQYWDDEYEVDFSKDPTLANVNFSLPKIGTYGKYKGKRLPAKFAFRYLSKYLTKEYKIPYGLYWGNDLKYKYKTISTDIKMIYEFDGDRDPTVNWTGSIVFTNGDYGYKEIKKYRIRDKYFLVKRYWRDYPVKCPHEKCECTLKIKAGNFLRYSDLFKECKKYDAIPYLDYLFTAESELPKLIRTKGVIHYIDEDETLEIDAFL